MQSTIANFVRNGFAAFWKARSRREIAWFAALAAASLILALLSAAAVSPFDSASHGPVENGWYELSQAIILAVSCVLFLLTAFRARHEIFYFAVTVGMFCVLAVVREMPRCSSAFYSGGACLPQSGKDTIVVGAAIALIALIAFKRVPFAKRWDELNFFYAVPAAFSVIFLAVAAVCETAVLVWMEEIFETAAYLNLLGFSVILYLRPESFEVGRGRGSA